jgi:hypothetical protein
MGPENLIFSLKNVVIVILACEFMKNLLAADRYKKYIGYALSVFVLGFIITGVRGAAFDLPDGYGVSVSENIAGEANTLKAEYEKQICQKVAAKLSEAKIEVVSVEAYADAKYNLTALNVKVKNDVPKATAVLEELGLKNSDTNIRVYD